MFEKSVDDRLSAWVQLRRQVDEAAEPFQLIAEFWSRSPFIPYNHTIELHNQQSWPSPWQIIVDNIYDDFTRALIIAWTVRLTERFANSKIEIRTMIDTVGNKAYNIVIIDDTVVVNFLDNQPITLSQIPSDIIIENIFYI
jgi:hypothetical protein